MLPAGVVPDDDALDAQLEQEMIFLGLIGMIDPPRDEVRAAIVVAKKAGIRTIMITGDHPSTAMAIATEPGLPVTATAVTGAALERLSDEELGDAVRESLVYARVNPEHKLRIVNAFVGLVMATGTLLVLDASLPGGMIGAVGLSLALHVAVIYVPFLQTAFVTTPLSGNDWLVCVLVASSVLWLRELSKLGVRIARGSARTSGSAGRRIVGSAPMLS